MKKRMVEIDFDTVLYRIWSIKASMTCKELLLSDTDILKTEDLDNILNNVYLKASNILDWFKYKYNKSVHLSDSYIKGFLRGCVESWEIKRFEDSEDLMVLSEDVSEMYDKIFYDSYADNMWDSEEVMWEVLSSKNIGLGTVDNDGCVEMDSYGGYLYDVRINDKKVISCLSNPDEIILAKEFIDVTISALDLDAEIIAMKVYEDRVNVLVATRGEGCFIADPIIKTRYAYAMSSVILYEYLEKIKKERMELTS